MFDGVALDINLNISTSKSVEPITDDELVGAVLAGDETAFNEIFERYRRLVAHLVSRFFNQRDFKTPGSWQPGELQKRLDSRALIQSMKQ